MAICDPTNSTYQALLEIIRENEAHFISDESEAGQRLHGGLGALNDGLVQVAECCQPIRQVAPNFDFSAEVKGNGFHSLCNICDSALQCVYNLCSKIAATKGSLVFRKMHYVREVEAWTQALGALITVLSFTRDSLLPLCTAPDGDLIMPHCNHKPEELITMLSTVPLHAFYGRCLGFHYISSLQKTFQLLTISLSAFSQAYYSDGSVWNKTKHSILASSQYILSPEQRARRLVTVMHYASVDFIKAFWDLSETEIVRQLPSLVSSSLAVYQAISVPCEEQSVPHCSEPDRMVVTPPPSSHVPAAPITCYLMSQHWRQGMPGSLSVKASSVQPASPNLIIHCHGGGFITQSTKSQEMFLREWAVAAKCPLLSIDYTLAPLAPYPRALEEVLTVYTWTLNHLHMLGTTGEKIVLTGDSAGGSLITGLTLRCLQLGIRPPDGLFVAYAPFMLKLLPSPAKMLAVMDPMLPLSFALRCLKAYAGHKSSDFVSKPDVVESTNDVQPDIQADATSSEETKDPQESLLDDDSPPAFSLNRTRLTIETGNILESCDLLSHEQTDPLQKKDAKDLDGMSASRLCLLSPSALSDAGSDTLTTISLASDIPRSKKEGEDKDDEKGPMVESDPEVNEVASTQTVEGKEERSRKYVAEFLQKYVLDSRVDKEGRSIPILRTDDSIDTTDGSEGQATGNGMLAATSNATWATFNKIGAAKDAMVSSLSAGISSAVNLTRRSSRPTDTDAASPDSEKASVASTQRPSSAQDSNTKEADEPTKSPNDSLLMDSQTLAEEFKGISILDDPFINPLDAPRHLLQRFPPISIMTVEFDFCLDDCVCMSRLLKQLGVSVTLDILPKLPHGFLNLCYLAPETKAGCNKAAERIKELLGVLEDGKEYTQSKTVS